MTKQQSIKEHRKMWHWIGEHVELLLEIGLDESIEEYFDEFFNDGNNYEKYFYSFCCIYSETSDSEFHCDKCPLNWNPSNLKVEEDILCVSNKKLPLYQLYDAIDNGDIDKTKEIINIIENLQER